jgi:hypothetical protein
MYFHRWKGMFYKLSMGCRRTLFTAPVIENSEPMEWTLNIV